MDYIIVDLEATRWEGAAYSPEMEIIEIGAVFVDGDDLLPRDDFVQFVRPTRHPDLSDLCKELTHIRQGEVDNAPAFPEAFSAFLDWIGGRQFKLCSWGQFDYDLFQSEFARHGVDFPDTFGGHLNLKDLFVGAYNARPGVGLKAAMKKMGLTFEGSPHRAIDDARNTARIARMLLVLDDTRPADGAR
jgi:3'-5' exoribonuclease 1